MDQTCVDVDTGGCGHHFDQLLRNIIPKAWQYGDYATFCPIWLETARATDVEPMQDVFKSIHSLGHH